MLALVVGLKHNKVHRAIYKCPGETPDTAGTSSSVRKHKSKGVVSSNQPKPTFQFDDQPKIKRQQKSFIAVKQWIRALGVDLTYNNGGCGILNVPEGRQTQPGTSSPVRMHKSIGEEPSNMPKATFEYDEHQNEHQPSKKNTD